MPAYTTDSPQGEPRELVWLTRAVFLLYAELRKQRFQKCQRPCENRLLVMVAVEEKVVDLCVNGRAGVLQIVRKKIVSGNVQGVGNRNEEFKTQSYLLMCNLHFEILNMVFETSKSTIYSI